MKNTRLLGSVLLLVGTALVVFCTLSFMRPGYRPYDAPLFDYRYLLSPSREATKLGLTAGVVLIVGGALLYRSRPN